MWSSPACGLKQYIAETSSHKALRWTDEAQAAIDTYAEQHKIERGDLELFNCVQVQYETQGPQDALRESIQDLSATSQTGRQERDRVCETTYCCSCGNMMSRHLTSECVMCGHNVCDGCFYE